MRPHRSVPALRNVDKKRRAIPKLIESLEERRLLSVNVLNYHGDIASTGVNSQEVQLTPTNVKVKSFGKLYGTTLDGQVYSEPLVDTGVTIAAGVNTKAGAAGVHDVVFVATENDTLYAIDSSVTGGAILWQRSFLLASGATQPAGDLNNTLGATVIAPVPNGDLNSSDINPSIGITGTPVIDPATGLIYLSVKTKETIGGVAHYVQRIHAINISDGTDAVTPYLIGNTSGTNTNSTSIYVYGTGDGNVVDPYNGTGKKVVQFNALREAQRCALSLITTTVNNVTSKTLYVSWASHGDNGPYHGMVVAWDVTNVTANGFQLKGVLNTSPNNGESGVWGGGGQLAFEPDGSAFYFMTGNGSGGAPTIGANGFPTDANYNEAVVKATLDPTTSPTNQSANGWGIKILDYFIPYNVAALDSADSDFGSGSPLLLPNSAGIPGHTQLLIAGGKDGRLYVLDRNSLGHYNATNDNVVNAVLNSSGHMTPPNAISGTLSTPSYYNGRIYAISGYNGAAVAFSLGTNGQLTATSQTAITNFGYLPGSLSISSSGTNNGIVWAMDTNLNEIHAYDASTFGTELWNSSQAAGGADNLGAAVKFAVPTIANGEVYVGTKTGLVVYGLTPAASMVSNAPVLTATALSGSSINLTWTDSSVAPNTASSYLIEESTDANPTFNQITTSPAGSTSISIGGLANLTKYYFRIRGANGIGDSKYSNTANATTTATTVSTIDFSGGFAGAGTTLSVNSPAVVSGANLELTNGGGNEAGSAFDVTPVDITNFTSQFVFQLTAGASTADGFTFAIQNVGPTAKGGVGSGLGYSGIAKSVAVKFDLYNSSGEGPDSTGLYTNGAAPQNVGSINLTPTGLDLHSGHVFRANLSYNGTTLSVTITDTQTGTSATQNYTVNIPSIVGASTAYAGFTGGTGGVTATQNIQSWTFTPAATSSPNAPTGLGGSAASATTVYLSWTPNATNQTGYHLDRALDSNFTQGLITETLPASPASFTDSMSGLAPGSTFYYRIRAFNGAGDSGNSNFTSVTIPIAPPKPTDQAIQDITSSEIDLSWTDNAGHLADGYQILRSTNNGSFSVVATLPPTSRPAPSEYDWPDTNVTPGTHYDYHIEAYNVSGYNDFAGLSASTLTVPPAGFTATPGNNVVNLAWAPPTGAVTYNVYKGTTAGGESTTPLITGLTTASYSDMAVTNGNTYFYYVTAVNSNTGLPNESLPSQEQSVIPGTVPVPTPVANYTFSESSGTTTADASGNGNTGTLINGPTFVAGRSGGGNALSLNGTNQSVQIANSASLNPTSAITLSAWIDATDWNGNRRILQKGASDNQYRLLAESGVLKFDLKNVGTVTATLPTTGTWHLITGTYDGSTMTLYVDGVAVASAAHTGAIATTGDPLAIGAKAGSTTAGDFFHGLLDDVRIYNSALSASAVSSLYGTAQIATQVRVTPGSAIVSDGASQPFSASELDQLGNPMATQPTLAWSIDSGGLGTINASTGAYTAPSTGSGSATVRATDPGTGLFGEATVSYSTVTVAGPVASYAFSESSGTTTADASGNGNTGTLINGPTFVAGRSGGGNALSLNGTNQSVQIANSASLNPTSAITLSAWIDATDWNGNRRILQKGASDNQYRLLAESGVLKFDLKNVGTVTATLPTTGTWHLITGTYDGSTMTLYVDGVAVASAAHTGAIATTGDPLAIGAKAGSTTAGDFFHGLLDDVRIYNSALSASAVSALIRLRRGRDAGPRHARECERR